MWRTQVVLRRLATHAQGGTVPPVIGCGIPRGGAGGKHILPCSPFCIPALHQQPGMTDMPTQALHLASAERAELWQSVENGGQPTVGQTLE